MTTDAQRLLEEALRLSETDRATIVGQLLASLDDSSVDDEAAELWSGEILKRVRELDDGTVQPVPWEVARRQIRE